MQESDGQILLDHQRFVGLFQRYLLPSSSGVVPRNEAPNDKPLIPHPSGVLSSTEAPNDHPLVPSLSRALSTAETSPELEKSKSLSGRETSEYQGAVAYAFVVGEAFVGEAFVDEAIVGEAFVLKLCDSVIVTPENFPNLKNCITSTLCIGTPEMK
ncbi:hypothetical protein ACFX2B_029185 [Malus domestica]